MEVYRERTESDEGCSFGNIQPGEIFGEGALLGAKQRNANVRATTKTKCFALPRETLVNVSSSFTTLIYHGFLKRAMGSVNRFQDCSAKIKDQIIHCMETVRLEKDQVLFERGDQV